jgi:hypothetical protein
MRKWLIVRGQFVVIEKGLLGSAAPETWRAEMASPPPNRVNLFQSTAVSHSESITYGGRPRRINAPPLRTARHLYYEMVMKYVCSCPKTVL